MNWGEPVTTQIDLSVAIGTVKLRNPILAASGTFGYGVEFAHLVNLERLGGFVTKGLSLGPMEGAPAPRLSETPSGMLNAVGLQNIGVTAFVRDKLPLLRKYNTQVVVNVFGYCLEDYAEAIRRLEDAEGIAAYELNISCPNVKRGGIQFGSEPSQVSEVVRAARKAAGRRPLWIKLMPLVADIAAIAKAATEAGADGLTVANTYPAMDVDFRSGRSRIGNLTGGLSGPAIRPITMRLVWAIRKAVETPILALGGVETVEDVLNYVTVGASAVQVGTASFSNPRASEGLVDGLERALYELNISRISELRDRVVAENG